MTIKEIAPFISCYCSESDFEEAKKTYQEIYVITLNGIFKYVKFRYDRYLCIKVPSIPGLENEKTAMKEELHFLPAGKIPYNLYKQIVAFFKKVIEVKKNEVEAHVHILWNPTLGYYLSVPNQRVSKASVSYDFNHVGKDDVIVADFHSHNTMNAFYSGTDDADDKNKIYYTGVVGKINNPVPDVVLRFNYKELKRNCELNEIFEITADVVDVPEEWVNRITTQQEYHRQNHQTGTGSPGYYGRYKDHNMNRMLNSLPFGYGGDDVSGGTTEKKELTSEERKSRSVELLTYLNSEDEDSIDVSVDPCGNIICRKVNDNVTQINTNVPKKKEKRQSISNTPGFIDYLTMTYGEEVACSYDVAMGGLDDIDDGCDEVLLDIIREAYSKLSESGKTEFKPV